MKPGKWSHMRHEFCLMFPEGFYAAWCLIGSDGVKFLVGMMQLANQENEVSATLQDLEDATGLSRATIHRRLRLLKEKGLIQKQGHHWIVNGRVFWKGRLCGRSDNIVQFEEIPFYGNDSEECVEDEGPESEGSGVYPSAGEA